MISSYIDLAVLLVMVHFVCDYPLQSDAIARGKNPDVSDGALYGVPWVYWMLGHACTHGVGVYFVTTSVPLAFLEMSSHFIVDLQKCKKRLTIHQDQLAHIAIKLVIAGLAIISQPV